MTHYVLFSFFKLSANAWYQQKEGILDKAQWLGWEYSPEFQTFLSRTKPPDERGNLTDLFDYVQRDA